MSSSCSNPGPIVGGTLGGLVVGIIIGILLAPLFRRSTASRSSTTTHATPRPSTTSIREKARSILPNHTASTRSSSATTVYPEKHDDTPKYGARSPSQHKKHHVLQFPIRASKSPRNSSSDESPTIMEDISFDRTQYRPPFEPIQESYYGAQQAMLYPRPPSSAGVSYASSQRGVDYASSQREVEPMPSRPMSIVLDISAERCTADEESEQSIDEGCNSNLSLGSTESVPQRPPTLFIPSRCTTLANIHNPDPDAFSQLSAATSASLYSSNTAPSFYATAPSHIQTFLESGTGTSSGTGLSNGSHISTKSNGSGSMMSIPPLNFGVAPLNWNLNSSSPSNSLIAGPAQAASSAPATTMTFSSGSGGGKPRGPRAPPALSPSPAAIALPPSPPTAPVPPPPAALAPPPTALSPPQPLALHAPKRKSNRMSVASKRSAKLEDVVEEAEVVPSVPAIPSVGGEGAEGRV